MLMATTNDQWQDQRMQRWCQTLVECGWKVNWVGVDRKRPVPLKSTESICYDRLRVIPLGGPVFYSIFNIRLFLKAMALPADAFLAVDADTLPALRLASLIRRKPLWFDAHEWFTETPELLHRPFIRNCWRLIIRIFLRGKIHCFTVGHELALRLEQNWGHPFIVLRNMPSDKSLDHDGADTEFNKPNINLNPIIPGLEGPYLLYQGALNIGRGLESLIEAAALGLPYPLVIAGSGDLQSPLMERIHRYNLSNKVLLLGAQEPEQLRIITSHAFLGFNLLETQSLNYYYSLANKFFDYVQAGVPQVCINFPEYRYYMELYRVGSLIENTEPSVIAQCCHHIVNHKETYKNMQDNCRQAAGLWNWKQESSILQNNLRQLRSTLPKNV